MATESLPHAEAALAALAEQFAHWRQRRATAQERIPPPLWEQAVELTGVLPRCQAAKRLRLSPTDLRKRCLAPSARGAPAAPPPAFVEVRGVGSAPAAPVGATVIETERPDGVRLRLRYPDSPPSLTAVLQAFLASACCC